MPNIYVLAIEVAVLGLLYAILSLNVIRYRHQNKVASGDAGNLSLEKATRAHANFAEYVPLSLIMQSVLIFLSANEWVIVVLAVMLMVGRLSHAMGLLKYELSDNPDFKYRKIGMKLTIFGLILSSILLIVMIILNLILFA